MFKLVNREVFSNANFNSGRFQCAAWLTVHQTPRSAPRGAIL
jgi:hypothetical protein